MDIDLQPHEWKSELKRPREPFWGPGALEALAYAIGWVLTVSLVHWLAH